MKVVNVEQGSDAWLNLRKGKITGSKLKDVVSEGNITTKLISAELEKLEIPFDKKAKKEELESLLPIESRANIMVSGKKKIEFYQLLADRLSIIEEEEENPMDRGHTLETPAIKEFEKMTGKKVEVSGMWLSDADDNIACSPDGAIFKGKNIVEAVEIKCLKAAKHLKAWFEQEIPEEYWYQKLQYFIVNEKLETLYFCMYDPRVTAKPFFYIEVKRADVEADIEFYRQYQKSTLSEIDRMVDELAF